MAVEANVSGRLQIRAVSAGEPQRAEFLRQGEKLHRAFQSQIPENYVNYIDGMLSEGSHLVHLLDMNLVVALAVWRTYHTTYAGRVMVVDDLVTDEAHRSRGLGGKLLGFLENQAIQLSCAVLQLDSAVHRARAHAFYFREGLHISAFHLQKKLK